MMRREENCVGRRVMGTEVHWERKGGPKGRWW